MPNVSSTSKPQSPRRNPPDPQFGDGVYCPRCQYHLRGIPEAACPECGFAYDHQGIRAVARNVAYAEDAGSRRAIWCGAFAGACFLGEAFEADWPSVVVEFLCILGSFVCAVGLFWYYKNLTAPNAWTFFWKFLSFAGCAHLAVLLVTLPTLGRWLGLLFCGIAWVALLALRTEFPEALSAIAAEDRKCVQFRMLFALAMVGLSTGLGVMAWG